MVSFITSVTRVGRPVALAAKQPQQKTAWNRTIRGSYGGLGIQISIRLI